MATFLLRRFHFRRQLTNSYYFVLIRYYRLVNCEIAVMTYPIDFGCVSLSDFFVKPEVEIWRFFDCLCKYSVAVTDDIEMVCSLCLLPALALKLNVESRISNIKPT